MLAFVSRPGTLVRARQALELSWSTIQGLLPIPSATGTLTHITVCGTANRNHSEPIPQSLEDFKRLFPRLHAPGTRYSERPDGRVDLTSDFVPRSWGYHLHAGPSMRISNRCTIAFNNDAARDFCRRSVGMPLGAASSADGYRHALRQLITACEAAAGYASPMFSTNRVNAPRSTYSPDQAGGGTGWLTYVRVPGYDARAYEWGATAVEAFAGGWLLQAPSEDPINDGDLFDKIVVVRDQIRRNGDVIRRQQAAWAGLAPDTLPPHPIGPQYLLEDGDSPCAAPPTAGF